MGSGNQTRTKTRGSNIQKRRNTPNHGNSRVTQKKNKRILEKSGIRKPLPVGQKRYDVPVMNGFRRFWNKACKESI